MRLRRRAIALAIAAAAAGAAIVSDTSASNLIDRNADDATLAVDARGEALVTYRAGASAVHLLAWGAVNARPPAEGRPQVEFELDYAGGWGKYRRAGWSTLANACGPYPGPPPAR